MNCDHPNHFLLHHERGSILNILGHQCPGCRMQPHRRGLNADQQSNILVAIWRGERIVTQLSVRSYSTDEEIRALALESHDAVPLCNEGEAPFEKRNNIVYGEVKRYELVPVKI